MWVAALDLADDRRVCGEAAVKLPACSSGLAGPATAGAAGQDLAGAPTDLGGVGGCRCGGLGERAAVGGRA